MVGSIPDGYSWQDTVSLARFDASSGVSKVQSTSAGASWTWTGSNQVPIPFTRTPASAVATDELHVAVGADFRIEVFRDGALAEIYGVQRSPRPVTARDLSTARSAFEEMPLGDLRTDYLASFDSPARPTQLPGYDRLLVSDRGDVWAHIYTVDPFEAGVWEVFRSEHELLGQVRLPASFNALAVHNDQILGIRYDALGVEHLESYRVNWINKRGP
jgi:hypothetical protein